MKRLLVLCVSWLPIAVMAADVCNQEADSKYFLSQWSQSSEHPEDILSSLDGKEFSIDPGHVVFSGDLNGDGIQDFIFNSLVGIGSSMDSTFAFLIQCRGYLRYSGGGYFAGVKVLDGPAKGGGEFKDIEIYSYIRDKRGRIRYKGEKAMTRPHLWQFDPQTQRYEGQAE
ncbi:hypothetical protein SAMN04488483_4224 [Pseudomonas helmanticensis]|uniref:Uncharacterized protein n=1 Tax=Pseudomonas helmanticensis TaxID=1471381 RepID=A0ACD2U9W1_9PSED|nr:hypothetical protein [Pseudomonas helmanticensis]SMQ28313.1 hypothetical protein SAMN04488483_4224 [Pseudomonas helmanticensis]